ncbi:hypothetical protein BDU57DRAFT_463544, partial [Ampelomyces quisqualis]
MNASATIRASYIRRSRMSLQPTFFPPLSIPSTNPKLEPRAANIEKLESFIPLDHIQYRSQCHAERTNVQSHQNADTEKAYIDLNPPLPFAVKLKKVLTTFPYRDPIYLVALIFLLGSIDLVINAFFELLPRTEEGMTSEQNESVAIPTTVLIGSILFFAAGVLDTVCALNADEGTVDARGVYKPAMLGSREFTWLPSWSKVFDMTMNNLAFQAGLLVLFGGVVFMFAGIVDFPGVVPEEDTALFGFVVFGPQVVHGLMFFVANVMLAVSVQDRWFRPKVWDADWQGALLNAVGGFAFMVAGFFLFSKKEEKAGVAAMVGSWAFLVGSVERLWVVVVV